MNAPTRRDVLTAGICAAAAAPLFAFADRARAPWSPQPQPPQPWSPKKAVKIGMVAVDGPLADKFALLRECGFDGVELDRPSDVDLAEAKAAAAATGLVIHGVVDSVHWQKPLSDPDEAVRAAGRAALEHALRDAHELGATSVLLVPAVVTKQVSYLDAWRRSLAEVRAVLPLAERLSIDVLIENVWNRFLLGPTELQRYVDELGSERAGVYFDPGNLVQFGFPEHWVEVLGARIRKVDVKDYRRGKAGYEGFDVALGDGDADWPAIVRALRSASYDGWFTAEMRGGDEAFLRDLAARMGRLLHA